MYCKSSLRYCRVILLNCINSSKVYCKFYCTERNADELAGINSSKVYCKWEKVKGYTRQFKVLIVAKCIVNNPKLLY